MTARAALDAASGPPTPELVERAAEAIAKQAEPMYGPGWDALSPAQKGAYRDQARAALAQRAGEPPTPEEVERVIREAWTAGARDRNADWKEWWLAHRDSVLTVLGQRAGEPPTPDDAREWTIGSAIRNGQHRHPTIEGSPWPAVDEPVVVVPKSRLGGATETCDECGRTGVLEPTNSPEDGTPLCPTCAVAWAISEPPPYSVTERLLGALQRIIEWDEREKPHKNLPLRDCADLARAAISAVRRPGE